VNWIPKPFRSTWWLLWAEFWWRRTEGIFRCYCTVRVCTCPMSCRIRFCFYHRWWRWLIESRVRPFHNVLAWISRVLGNGKCDWDGELGQMRLWKWLMKKVWVHLRSQRRRWLFRRDFCLQSWGSWLLWFRQGLTFRGFCLFFFCSSFLNFFFSWMEFF
jgi:hypothetical protein